MKMQKSKKILVLSLLLISISVCTVFAYLQLRNAKYEFEITSPEFIYGEVDGLDSYFVYDEVSEIKGIISGKKPNKIKYTLYGSEGYVLKKGSVKLGEECSIDDLAFLQGPNILYLEAEYTGRVYPVRRVYVIYNENEENEKRLGLEGKDTDGDGLDDLFELKNSYTSPKYADTDENGIDDGEEDPDQDGLKNKDELRYRLLANEPDSDLDGINDGDELHLGCDPAKYDSDDDGVSDYCENMYGLDPTQADDDYTVNYVETVNVSEDCSIEVSAKMDARNIYGSFISTFPAFAVILDEDLDCVLPNGIVMSPDTRKSDVSIKVASNPGEDLYVCTVNENGELTAVNFVGAGGLDISEYMKEDKGILFFTDIKTYLGRVSGRGANYQNVAAVDLSQIDSDRDGFTDDIDLTKDCADVFRSYDDYIQYFYNGKDVMSFFCWPPIVGSPTVLNLNPFASISNNLNTIGSTGHSWVVYSNYEDVDILEDGKLTHYSNRLVNFIAGFFPESAFSDLSLFSFEVSSLISTSEGDYHIRRGFPVKFKNSEKSKDGLFAPIILPIQVDSSIKDQFKTYIKNYKSLYNLYTNNCTSFARDCFKKNGIKLRINIYKKPWGENMFTIHYTNGVIENIGEYTFLLSNSPGRAGYSIIQNYPSDYICAVEMPFSDATKQHLQDDEEKIKKHTHSTDYKHFYGLTSKKVEESSFKVIGLKSKEPKGENTVVIDDQPSDQDSNNTSITWNGDYLDMICDVLPYLDTKALFDDSITYIGNLSDEEKVGAVFEALTWGAQSLKHTSENTSSWPSYYVYDVSDVKLMASLFKGKTPSNKYIDKVAKGLAAAAVNPDESIECFKRDGDRFKAVISQAGGPGCRIDDVVVNNDSVDIYYSILWQDGEGIPWVAHFVPGEGGLPKFDHAERGGKNNNQDGDSSDSSCYKEYAKLMVEYKNLALRPFTFPDVNNIFYGYALHDVNQDGTPELIMVASGVKNDSFYELLRMYTYQNGEAVPVIMDDYGKSYVYSIEGNKIRLHNLMVGTGLGGEAAFTFDAGKDKLTLVEALSCCATEPNKHESMYYRVTKDDGFEGSIDEMQYFCFDYNPDSSFKGHTISYDEYKKGISGYDFIGLDFEVEDITDEAIEKVRKMN